MKGRACELHLHLDADRTLGAEVSCGVDRVFEQRGLADTSLPVHRKHTAPAYAGAVQQFVEHTLLALTTKEIRPRRAPDHPRSMPLGTRPPGVRNSIAGD
jgi:hypothetical protein